MGKNEGKAHGTTKLTGATGWPQRHWRLIEVFEMVSHKTSELLCGMAPSAGTEHSAIKHKRAHSFLLKPFCHLCEGWVQPCLHVLEMILTPLQRLELNTVKDTQLQSVLSLAGYFRGQQASRIKNESCRKIKCEFWKLSEHDLALLLLEARWEQSQAEAESSWKSHYECPFYYLHLLHILYSASLRAVDKNYFFFLHRSFNLETPSTILVFRFFCSTIRKSKS